MTYLLDTDTFSTAARDTSPVLRQRLENMATDHLAISAVTVGEVDFGIARRLPPDIVVARIASFRASLRVLPIDEDVARRYGLLRAHLERLGTPIGPNDLWIAALALALDLTLVTGNEREFARVPTLRVENWMR